MKINKVINNNVVGGIDPNGQEVILIGKGLGFAFQAFGELDKSLVQKKFHLDSAKSASQFAEVVKEIPYPYIQAAEEIITVAQKKLRHRLNRGIHVGITEHLWCVME